MTLKLAPCGHTCADCPSYRGEVEEHQCVGCPGAEGRPWWGECNLYACIKERGVEHCGLCEDFPCNLQVGHFNPDNPVGQRNAVMMTGVLAYWAKHGEKKTASLVEKLRAKKD